MIVCAKANPKIQRYGFISFLFAIGVFLLPFDLVAGPSFFGEFSGMASFFVFLPLIALSIPLLMFHPAPYRIAAETKWFIILTFSAIIISFLVNGANIADASLRLRSGFNKALTTMTAFSFCVALMLLAARLSQNPEFYRKVLLRPTLLVLAVVFPVCIIEIGSWWIPSMDAVYEILSDFFRGGAVYYHTMGRLQGVSGEPSFLALYMGFVLIWVLYLFISARSLLGRVLGFLLFIMSITFFIMTFARTAYVLLFGMISLWIFMPLILKGRTSENMQSFSLLWSGAFFVAFCLLLLLGRNETVAEFVVRGDSVSNLSRYASNYTAFGLFLDNPIFGIGLGQYAFQAQNELPSWAWKSYEIVNWFTNPDKGWPGVFSTPARISSELGVVGVVSWYLPIIHLFRRLLCVTRIERVRIGGRPSLGAALLLGMVYVLLYGIAQEGFRQLGAWIVLGAVSTYVSIPNPETFYALSLKSKAPKSINFLC